MIWNIYFGVVAMLTGFVLAISLAVGKASHIKPVRKIAEWTIFIFRGSPLFIQFFFCVFSVLVA
jgi:polar amino acid transport system permease protein